ncbi:hypothetical protein SBY92_000062 [Candida maltosa Xu316]
MSATPLLFHIRDYRGATIEDLNVQQAISINPSTSLSEAVFIGFENEFTYLPVIHERTKRLLGVINVEDIRNNEEKIKRSFLTPTVKNYMIWFNQKAKRDYDTESKKLVSEKTAPKTKILKPRGKKYEVLTPFTPLEDLAKFFNQGNYFAIVTNGHGDFVYGVVTPQDLMRYEQARPKL